MARVDPAVSVAGVDLFVMKNNACAPIEAVPQTGCSFGPNTLNFFAPTGLQFLIKVKANANINIAGKQSQRGIASVIIPTTGNTQIHAF